MTDYLRPVVAFDVDDTLLDRDGEGRKEVIEFLNLFKKFGCDVVVWSNGGGPHEESVNYARSVCHRLGIWVSALKKRVLFSPILQSTILISGLVSPKALWVESIFEFNFCRVFL
jgi:hypothetical protein